MGRDKGEKGRGFQKHVWGTHGQHQSGVGSRVGGGDGWGWGSHVGKMDTTVLEK